MNELEQWWVERSYRLPDDHVDKRNSKNPFKDFRDLEHPSLCFAGYLGADYRRGEGVMVVASVHRNFDSGDLVRDPGGVMSRMVQATQTLQTGPSPTDEIGQSYLDAVRPAYEAGLTGWTVAAHINRVYKAAHLTDPRNRRRIAYLNTSCGQYPEPTRGQPYPEEAKKRGNSIKTAMQYCCDRSHPLADVVDQLQPSVVICMSSIGDAGLRKARYQLPIVYIHPWENMAAKLMRPVTLAGTSFCKDAAMDEWLPSLSEHVDM